MGHLDATNAPPERGSRSKPQPKLVQAAEIIQGAR
jgi:hypothetical protein